MYRRHGSLREFAGGMFWGTRGRRCLVVTTSVFRAHQHSVWGYPKAGRDVGSALIGCLFLGAGGDGRIYQVFPGL